MWNDGILIVSKKERDITKSKTKQIETESVIINTDHSFSQLQYPLSMTKPSSKRWSLFWIFHMLYGKNIDDSS